MKFDPSQNVFNSVLDDLQNTSIAFAVTLGKGLSCFGHGDV